MALLRALITARDFITLDFSFFWDEPRTGAQCPVLKLQAAFRTATVTINFYVGIRKDCLSL